MGSHRSFLIPLRYHLVKIKERSRKKIKMHKSTIFLLTYCLGIFAVLPAASMPKIKTKRLRREIKGINTLTDDGEKMKLMQKYGVDTTTHFLKFFQKAIDDVEPSVKEIETATREFKAGIDSLDLEKFDYTKTFIGHIDEARNLLLEAKREFVALTSKVIPLCKNIEISIENWQAEHGKILLKNQFKQLTRLIEETKMKLETFIAKFKDLYSVDSNDSSEGFRGTIAKALKEGTPEYASWTNLIKGSHDGNSTTKTVGMVIAAIFDCSDHCDGVKTISAWFTSGTTEQDKIKDYKEQIKQIFDNSYGAYKKLDKLQTAAYTGWDKMKKRIKLVNAWMEEADRVKKTINSFTNDQMTDVVGYQETFKEQIDGLKKAAQKAYDSASPEKPSDQDRINAEQMFQNLSS